MLHRLLFALLIVGPALMGQSYVPISVGQLNCGAVRRSANTVQTYCYGPNNVLVHNSLETLVDQGGVLSGTGVLVTFQWEGDIVSWEFDLRGALIAYDIIGDLEQHLTGNFTTVYGAVAQGLGCANLTSDAPKFSWSVGQTVCTNVWAELEGAWQSCCGSL